MSIWPDRCNRPRSRCLICGYATMLLTVDYNCPGLPARVVRTIEAFGQTLEKAKMKTVQWIAASLVAIASVSAFAAAGGNGGGNGGSGGGGSSGGAGHGGLGGNAGGMSAGHMSSKGVSNTNGFRSADHDVGLARAADRSDTQADRADAQTSRASVHASHASHAHSRSLARVSTNPHDSQHVTVSHSN
jgi:hypothetical protein